METVEVTIPQGTLEGKLETTENGFLYKSFRGIPFAKPPVEDLRFRDPQPAEGWKGVRDATQDGNPNAQIDVMFTHKYLGVEDCLFLNVYVPHSAKADSSLPVMVWIHGGGFSMGSSDSALYGPDKLVEKDVVIVAINYRLGPLGFLCLNTDDAPGNAGMKDQVMALQWVQDNIKLFGGDPRNVTIFGESAGGASIQFLILSPMAKGLFHKAISQSGSCNSSWAIKHNPEEIATKFGEILGFTCKDKTDLLESLKKVPVEELIHAAASPAMSTFAGDIAFCPVVERNHRQTMFIHKEPTELLMTGEFNKVPTITGFNTKEGFLMLHRFIAESGIEKPTLEELIPDFDQLLPAAIRSRLAPEKVAMLSQMIKGFYFSNEGDDMVDRYMDFMSDYVFIASIDMSVKIFSKFPLPSFYYMFNYSGGYNIFKRLSKYPYSGAAHADELGYLFTAEFGKDVEPSEKDLLTIQRMTEMWTNFAKFTNPTPKLSEAVNVLWKPIDGSDLHCLSIDDDLSLIQNPLEERLNFWKNIFDMLKH